MSTEFLHLTITITPLRARRSTQAHNAALFNFEHLQARAVNIPTAASKRIPEQPKNPPYQYALQPGTAAPMPPETPTPSTPLSPRQAKAHLLSRRRQCLEPPQETQEGWPLANGDLVPGAGPSFQEKYELGRLLGSGAFADVWACVERPREASSEHDLGLGSNPRPPGADVQALHKGPSPAAGGRRQDTSAAAAAGPGRAWACKVVQLRGMGAHKRAMVVQEVAALRMLQACHNPGIVALREALQTTGAVQLVLEHCPGGDLQRLIQRCGPLTEPGARTVLCQVASALACCHEHGIMHRDIKPANILFSADPSPLCPRRDRTGKLLRRGQQHQGPPPVQAKLADFGLSVTVQQGETAAGPSGSPTFMAPEVLQGRRYGTEADVWSLGVLHCVMLSGELPFPILGRGRHLKLWRLRRAIGYGQVDFTRGCWVGVSGEAKDLIQRMLQVDGRKRPSAQEVLLHPWCSEDCGPVPGPVTGLPLAAESASSAQMDQSSRSTERGRSHVTDCGNGCCYQQNAAGEECAELMNLVEGQREEGSNPGTCSPFMWKSRIFPLNRCPRMMLAR